MRVIPRRLAPSTEREVGEVREMMKGIPMWAPFRSISEEIRPRAGLFRNPDGCAEHLVFEPAPVSPDAMFGLEIGGR